jgi:hypothetical protein
MRTGTGKLTGHHHDRTCGHHGGRQHDERAALPAAVKQEARGHVAGGIGDHDRSTGCSRRCQRPACALHQDQRHEAGDSHVLTGIAAKHHGQHDGARRFQHACNAPCACRTVRLPVCRRGPDKRRQAQDICCRDRQPQPAPAERGDDNATGQQHQPGTKRQIGTPKAHGGLTGALVSQPDDQTGQGHRHHEEPDALGHAGYDEPLARVHQRAPRPGSRCGNQADDCQPQLAEPVGQGAEETARQGSDKREHRYDKACLKQAQVKLFAQDGQCRRRLADKEGSRHASEENGPDARPAACAVLRFGYRQRIVPA